MVFIEYIYKLVSLSKVIKRYKYFTFLTFKNKVEKVRVFLPFQIHVLGMHYYGYRYTFY